MLKKLFARIAYHLDMVTEVPSQKVRDAMGTEGWEFSSCPYGSTVIDHPSFDAASGQRPLRVMPTEAIGSVYMAGTPEQIGTYKTAKKRIAAQVRGLNV